MTGTVQIIGGAFQDPAGNPLANGQLVLTLSQDAQVNAAGEVGSGRTTIVLLDGNGNILTSPPQMMLPNDVLSPANTYYTVSAYTADGQIVWGPNCQQILSAPSPFNVGAWVPGAINILGAGNPYITALTTTGTSGDATVQNGVLNIPVYGGGSAAVSSVFGRTGAVTAAAGDYTVAEVTGAAPLASPTFTGTVTAENNLVIGTSGTTYGVEFQPAVVGGSIFWINNAGTQLQITNGSSVPGYYPVAFSNLGDITAPGNLTLATSGKATSTANVNSPALEVQGQAWSGTANVADVWQWQNVLGTGANPTSTLTLTHSGSTGTSAVSVPNLALNPNGGFPNIFFNAGGGINYTANLKFEGPSGFSFTDVSGGGGAAVLMGPVTVSSITTSQTATASTTASNYSIPITVNGTVMYMRLSSTA